MYSKLEQLVTTRDSCCKEVDQLNIYALDDANISISYHCHLKDQHVNKANPQLTNKKTTSKSSKCKFCLVHDSLLKYEKILFECSNSAETFKVGEEDEDDQAISGETAWKLSRLELICSSVCAFAVSKCLPQHNQEAARNVKLLFSSLREEFKVLRSYWRCLTNRVAGHDELRMATERFRIVDPHVNIASEKTSNLIDPHMVRLDAIHDLL